MINLLPEGYKKEIRAARTNVVLLRYNLLALGAIAFVLLSCLAVYGLLGATKSNAEATNQDNAKRAVDYEQTRKEADEYRKNLEIARKILDNEVVYTDQIFTITNLLPSGVVLDSLNLNSKDFGTPVLVNAHAKNYDAVTNLKKAFEQSSYFSDVHFQSITDDGGNAAPGYPISVVISVTINKAVKK
jgi:Tfp pilus assembly protein PilN